MKKQFGKKTIFTLLVSFFVLSVSTTSAVASNESDAAKIRRAMMAAPGSIAAHATILDADLTVLREGSNGWTCFPGVPLIPGDKHPMCNDAVWMDWLYALFDGHYPTPPSTIGYSYMLRGDALVNNDNPAAGPGDPGMWDQEGPHLMILYPESVDISHLPRDPNAGGPYVMWDETPLVHVMVPLTDRDR
jgi:hypothetical protein